MQQTAQAAEAFDPAPARSPNYKRIEGFGAGRIGVGPETSGE